LGASRNITQLVAGIIVLIVGLVLVTVVADQTATITASANLGSFAGAGALLDLVPLVYVAAVVLIGTQLMTAGAGLGGLTGVARKLRGGSSE
jgi:hypothetical protein